MIGCNVNNLRRSRSNSTDHQRIFFIFVAKFCIFAIRETGIFVAKICFIAIDTDIGIFVAKICILVFREIVIFVSNSL